MKFYVNNIEKDTLDNDNFRKVLYTAAHSQLVVMDLKPGEDIGKEIHHDIDQFIRIEKGKGLAVLDGEEFPLSDDFALIIPAGTEHNVTNISDSENLKLYTIYSPAEHPDGTIHKTKKEAEEDHHH